MMTQDTLESFQVNVIGVANTVTAFLPLIKQGRTKKVITISTGMADLGTLFRIYSILQLDQCVLNN